MKRYLIILCSVIFSGCSTQPYSISASKVFKFGASLTEIEFQLSRKCDTLSLQQINPITAPLAKESQTQLNCSGFYYAGKKRNIELVFQDNQLDLVWILFPENEKTDVLEGFSESYGEPTKIIDFGSLYLNINAAIRNKPTEVLFVSDRQEKAMLKTLSVKSPK